MVKLFAIILVTIAPTIRAQSTNHHIGYGHTDGWTNKEVAFWFFVIRP